MSTTRADPPCADALRPGALGPWLRQGARAATLRPVQWHDGLQAHPVVPLVLVLLQWLLAVLVERLLLPGPARFYAPALLWGWTSTVLVAWLAHWMRPAPSQPGSGPRAVALFNVMAAQFGWISAAFGAVAVALVHADAADALGERGWWALYLGHVGWQVLSLGVLFARLRPRRPRPIALSLLLFASVQVWSSTEQPVRLWYPEAQAAEGGEPERPRLDTDAIEAQSQTLPHAVASLAPSRRGVVDLYAITFAPDGSEDVFLREGRMVSDVMAERFDAQGRTLRLANHPDAVRELPWATPANLRRAIQAVAARMHREEDILFLHLTSHGARDGQLAARLWPLDVAPVTPADLRRWLDEAGVRWRVISISACYSGSWLDPLAGDHTLVMTAADADHTSYGCGRRSELTFFGRAMYDEQLRRHTRSFEAAHAAARTVIERREQEAGKDDGYSNPQIRVGTRVREILQRLLQRLETAPAPR